VPESPSPESAPPPLGKPIYDELSTPDSASDSDQPREGEHVVVTPFTAGSAGGAHTQQES
jgi:hypothetical protein